MNIQFVPGLRTNTLKTNADKYTSVQIKYKYK